MTLKSKIVSALALMFLASAPLAAQDFTVDTSASKITWKGTKVGGAHEGEVPVQTGKLVLKDNKLVGGEIVVNMAGMTNTDLSGEWSDKLLAHLKNDDFFATDKFATSKIVFNKVTELSAGKYKVEGDLTIKDIKKPIVFETTLKNEDGKVSGKTDLVFNRAHYDIKYNSGSFFENLGDKLIHDDVQLSVALVANKK